ncbi:hypothetical protein JKP88DRAFT_269955 [Tribonema minus]|uniref:CNNM transmembrane domain-containing protein n=1 Tax=Tribonema minus TaxID=303371 RepID=A0A835YX11_9STRA|nr:hypothetical protein JKP88DRAFT_269955 [Tribonema minus]
MGLDQVGLQIVAEGGDAKEAKAAKKIIPLRKRGNLLLCTLVVMNVAINSLISILSAGLAGGLLGFACSTILITIFGEIVPQAVCSRHALQIGAAVGPVMYVMMVLFYPICKPLAFILDKCLGEEVGTIHTRTELRELLNIHVKHGAIDVETGREMAGALKYKDLLVRAVMTPKEKVFMLSADARLDYRTVRAIFGTGFSRIPVHGASTDDIVGLLFTKDLIFIDPVDATPVKNFIQVFGRAVHAVWPDQPLGDVLKVFKGQRAHMAIVRDVNSSGPGDPFYEVAGIITLEDIIEEVLGDEILDETDTLEHVASTAQRAERCNVEATRLHLLNASTTENKLSREEASAVAAHLSANVEQFGALSKEAVTAVVAASTVVTLRREASAGAAPAAADYLYRRGRVSTACTLVLTGRLTVAAGRDAFQSESGPWSVLGADALLAAEGAYRPDFSASISSDQLRVIRMNRATFAALKPTVDKRVSMCHSSSHYSNFTHLEDL